MGELLHGRDGLAVLALTAMWFLWYIGNYGFLGDAATLLSGHGLGIGSSILYLAVGAIGYPVVTVGSFLASLALGSYLQVAYTFTAENFPTGLRATRIRPGGRRRATSPRQFGEPAVRGRWVHRGLARRLAWCGVCGLAPTRREATGAAAWQRQRCLRPAILRTSFTNGS
jgi:hypothetical protein